jgi:hypothetical protein
MKFALCLVAKDGDAEKFEREGAKCCVSQSWGRKQEIDEPLRTEYVINIVRLWGEDEPSFFYSFHMTKVGADAPAAYICI